MVLCGFNTVLKEGFKMEGLSLTEYISLAIAAISILGSMISLGVVFGSLRGKVKEAFNTMSSNEKHINDNINTINNNISRLGERLDKLEDRDRSIEKFVERRYDDLRKYVDSNFKDLNTSLKEIENVCFCRKTSVEKIPDLDERVRQLEIDVGVLPSKLSEELSKAFSEEYKNIVSTLSNKDKK